MYLIINTFEERISLFLREKFGYIIFATFFYLLDNATFLEDYSEDY